MAIGADVLAFTLLARRSLLTLPLFGMRVFRRRKLSFQFLSLFLVTEFDALLATKGKNTELSFTCASTVAVKVKQGMRDLERKNCVCLINSISNLVSVQMLYASKCSHALHNGRC